MYKCEDGILVCTKKVGFTQISINARGGTYSPQTIFQALIIRRIVNCTVESSQSDFNHKNWINGKTTWGVPAVTVH